MSSKELDNFFGGKFEAFEVPPSDEAWEELQKGLSQKKHRLPGKVIMVAASSLLMLISGYLLLDESTVAVQDEGNFVGLQSLRADWEGLLEEHSVFNQEGLQKQPAAKKKFNATTTSSVDVNKVKWSKPDDIQGIAQDLRPVKTIGLAKTGPLATQRLPGQLSLETNNEVKEKETENLPVRIIYKNSDSGDEIKGLNKVWALAREIREADVITYGDLREAKNELIARNLKKVALPKPQ